MAASARMWRDSSKGVSDMLFDAILIGFGSVVLFALGAFSAAAYLSRDTDGTGRW